MGERSDADEVHTSLGIGPNVFQHNAARGFRWNPAVGFVLYLARELVNTVHGDFDGCGRHVIQQNGLGTELQRLFKLGWSSHLDLHTLALAPVLQSLRKRLADAAAERDVVVLDEDAAGQVETVIGASSGEHGILFQRAQPWDGLAGVEHVGFRAVHGVDILASQGGDAAKVLHEIENHALAAEQDLSIVANHGQNLSVMHPNAVKNLRMADHLVPRLRRRPLVQMAENVKNPRHAPQARVLDTRKTVPGLRTLEKYAVMCGGGTNHRLDLASGILIKNNHISLGGGIPVVLTRALEKRQAGQRVQIEVRSTKELEQALEFGAEAILLDNMTPAQVRDAVDRIKEEKRWIPTEASGGIVLENIRSYAEAGVDFISVGALTHSAKAADISMRIDAE